MKKVTQNLWISIGICILSLALAIIPVFLLLGVGNGMEFVSEFFGQIWENGEVDTVEGHAAIIVGALGFLGVLGEIMIIFILLGMSFYVAFSLFCTLIARIIYAPQKGWRLVTYRVLMTILYLSQMIGVGLCFLFAGIEGLSYKLIFIPMGVLMLAGIVYSAINTYSGRILE